MAALTKQRVGVGLDIGSDSVKVCRLLDGPEGLELTNAARVEIYPENVAERLADGIEEKLTSPSTQPVPIPKKERERGELEDKEKSGERKDRVVKAIKKAMEEADIKEREVTSAVSGQAVIVRYIEMPYMSSEELSGAIKYEAEQYIPFELENVEVDYQILEEKMPQHPDKMRVLLVAAKKELIKEHLSFLEGASLKPVAIDVDAFALINAFERIKVPAKEECLALINIGRSLTNINILRGGIAYFTRDVFLAGRDISDGLAKRFGMEFNQAEKLKRERGKATGDDTFNKTLSSALGDLVGEIRLSFDYYENQALEKNIGHVFLTGGTSLLPELDHFLSDTLGLKVATWHPFEGLKVTEGVKAWESISPTMAVSLGLALHTEND